MDQVFDFREFVLMLLKKCRLPLILLVIIGILGAGFGYWRGSRVTYLSTSSATVTLSRASLDPSALTNSMKDVNDLASSDFFYFNVGPNLKQLIGEDTYLSLFPKKKEPTLAKLKEIVKYYVKGNLFLVDVKAPTEELASQASAAAMTYALGEIDSANQNVTLTLHGQTSVNLNEQNGDDEWGGALKFGLLGMAGGFALGVLWIFFADVFSLKVKSGSDLRKYSLPLLGELETDEKGGGAR